MAPDSADLGKASVAIKLEEDPDTEEAAEIKAKAAARKPYLISNGDSDDGEDDGSWDPEAELDPEAAETRRISKGKWRESSEEITGFRENPQSSQHDNRAVFEDNPLTSPTESSFTEYLCAYLEELHKCRSCTFFDTMGLEKEGRLAGYYKSIMNRLNTENFWIQRARQQLEGVMKESIKTKRDCFRGRGRARSRSPGPRARNRGQPASALRQVRFEDEEEAGARTHLRDEDIWDSELPEMLVAYDGDDDTEALV
ncbi:hypothetical protein ESCO_001953 [Escovopsis weberi]|uniref:Uncharacterized protein n=1 Tax=Escovopsis weberi TaxID=150374 RepID=A0A0M8N924_ESCWE|nr:hypothetical protein ESCO_001953 [Escovopsis weberi]